MKTKITRREVVVAAGGMLAVQVGNAQTAASPADLARAARELNQRSGDALAKFEIPLSTEPAFQFKA